MQLEEKTKNLDTSRFQTTKESRLTYHRPKLYKLGKVGQVTLEGTDTATGSGNVWSFEFEVP